MVSVAEPFELSVIEAAKYVGVSRRTISDWIRDGVVPSRKDGRRRMIPVAHLAQRKRDRFFSSTGRLPGHHRHAAEGA